MSTKKIGFIDLYISEWHANNYPAWIKKACEEFGYDYSVAYAWAEDYVSPTDGRNTDEWCEAFGVEQSFAESLGGVVPLVDAMETFKLCSGAVELIDISIGIFHLSQERAA